MAQKQRKPLLKPYQLVCEALVHNSKSFNICPEAYSSASFNCLHTPPPQPNPTQCTTNHSINPWYPLAPSIAYLYYRAIQPFKQSNLFILTMSKVVKNYELSHFLLHNLMQLVLLKYQNVNSWAIHINSIPLQISPNS